MDLKHHFKILIIIYIIIGMPMVYSQPGHTNAGAVELCFCKSKVKVEVVWRLGQLRFIVQSPDYGPVGLGNSPGGLGRPRYTSWIETLKE